MTEQAIEDAAERLAHVALHTPLTRAEKLSAELSNNVFLKREDLQPIHSFKIRGAYNKMVQLTPAERKRGVIAASAGNHAQGVALSAQKLGMHATIVMPRTTPDIKIQAVRGYGAEVVLAGDNYSEAYDHCLELLTSSRQVFIHPFDDPEVIAGQGTIGKEILDDLADVTHVFVPVGGGGLIAGVATYIKAKRPEVQVIGVEPEDSNALQLALKHDAPTALKHVGIFADGVAVKQAGEHTFALAKQYVDAVITVDNDQICAAIKAIYEDTRSIVEPAGALAAAGARTFAEQSGARGQTFAVICSGANMSFEKLQFVAERTLLGSGNEALFAITLPEEPGALEALCDRVVDGHNITEFCYRLHRRDTATIFIGFTMRDKRDGEKFIATMQNHRYEFTDLSGDDIAKEHIRHMIGGVSPAARDEHIYEIDFPERPRALNDFLKALNNAFNISLFHYRGQGGDVGSVLIGFEAADRAELEKLLDATTYDYRPAHSSAAHIFLKN